MSFNHSTTMSKNKAIYLFIAQQVWCTSDIWEEQIIEDIEATGGVFSDDNAIIMDYDVNSNPPQGELEEVIARWKVMMNKAEENDEIVSSTHNPLRKPLPFREWVNQWFFLKLGFPGESGSFPWFSTYFFIFSRGISPVLKTE